MKQAGNTTSVIPPELQAPPPRAVRRRGIPFGRIGLRLFMLPHALVGLGVLLIAVGEPLLILLTPAVAGVVTDITATHGSKGGTTWYLKFAYSAHEPDGNIKRFGEDKITPDEAGSLRVGDPISVYVASLGTYHYTILSRSSGGYIGHRWTLWVWALFWNVGVSAFLYSTWREPMRRRRLVREGEPVIGEIMGKSIRRGKSTSYSVQYSFTTTGLRPSRQNNAMTITSKEYEKAREGDAVVILYNPDHPERSVIYEFSGFVAETL